MTDVAVSVSEPQAGRRVFNSVEEFIAHYAALNPSFSVKRGNGKFTIPTASLRWLAFCESIQVCEDVPRFIPVGKDGVHSLCCVRVYDAKACRYYTGWSEVEGGDLPVIYAINRATEMAVLTVLGVYGLVYGDFEFGSLGVKTEAVSIAHVLQNTTSLRHTSEAKPVSAVTYPKPPDPPVASADVPPLPPTEPSDTAPPSTVLNTSIDAILDGFAKWFPRGGMSMNEIIDHVSKAGRTTSDAIGEQVKVFVQQRRAAGNLESTGVKKGTRYFLPGTAPGDQPGAPPPPPPSEPAAPAVATPAQPQPPPAETTKASATAPVNGRPPGNLTTVEAVAFMKGELADKLPGVSIATLKKGVESAGADWGNGIKTADGILELIDLYTTMQ